MTRSGYETKTEAEADLDTLLREQTAGVYRKNVELIMDDWLAEWIDSTPDLADTTRDGYRAHIRNYLSPALGEFQLVDLTQAMVRSFYGSLAQPGASLATGKRLSDRTIHRVHITLHSALEAARRERLIYVNVADGMHSEPNPGEEGGAWTVEETRRFLNSVRDDRWYPMWRIFCMTGMRRGEVAGLKWSDVDLNRRVLTVRRSRVRTSGGIVVTPPKTKRGRRTIDLDAATVDTLVRWQAVRLAEAAEIGETYSDGDWVLAWEDGRPIDPTGISRQFSRRVKRAPVPPIRLHDLRHSHVTQLLLAGTPIHVVSRRAGHASEAFTLERYSHVLPGQQRDAVDRVASLIDA